MRFPIHSPKNNSMTERELSADCFPKQDQDALWHALTKAREDAARSSACAAEASALADSQNSQLQHAHGEYRQLLLDLSAALGSFVGDENRIHSAASIVSRVRDLKLGLDATQEDLQSACAQLHEEQTKALKVCRRKGHTFSVIVHPVSCRWCLCTHDDLAWSTYSS